MLVATAGAARVSPIQDKFEDEPIEENVDDDYPSYSIGYSNSSNKHKEKPKQEIWTTSKTHSKRKKAS